MIFLITSGLSPSVPDSSLFRIFNAFSGFSSSFQDFIRLFSNFPIYLYIFLDSQILSINFTIFQDFYCFFQDIHCFSRISLSFRIFTILSGFSPYLQDTRHHFRISNVFSGFYHLFRICIIIQDIHHLFRIFIIFSELLSYFQAFHCLFRIFTILSGFSPSFQFCLFYRFSQSFQDSNQLLTFDLRLLI